ncbi:hypothetical protein RU86_GL002045 [Lactococcus piscium]|uniref:DJ-1/PfpI domain-containing protein n=2 Tax=Pseudolactococcus piscium TaxID=1364 RepID=A0A2A5S1F1_9LACT|nr:hypothetical protein RU86_GL002045 [Lactococcus piscium]
MDTMADWQYAYLLPLLNNDSFYEVDHDKIELKMVGADIRPIKTAGGLKIIPDCSVAEIDISADTALLLAGADTWHDKKHKAILSMTEKVSLENGTVVSICASVGALNSLGILATRKHTSNALDFLKLVSDQYVSEANYS